MSKKGYQDPTARRVNVIPLLVIMVLVLALAAWGVSSMLVEDPLWFASDFQEKASTMILYWDGTETRLEPGTPEYALVQKALEAEFSQIKSWSQDAGMSDATLAELQQKGRLLEVHYDQPVRIHSPYHILASDVFYIPLSGFNFDRHRVYTQTRVAPLELKSLEQIFSAAQQVAQGKTN
jgi:hypothetical protein